MAGRARVKKPRVVKNGTKRYDVVYRVGGGMYPEQHGGTFPTKAPAAARCDVINGVIASARTSEQARLEIKALLRRAEYVRPRTLETVLQDLLKSSVHLAANTLHARKDEAKRLAEWADKDPFQITPDDIQDLIVEHSARYKPASLRRTITLLTAALDYAGVDPNPVRHRNVRLPKQAKQEFQVVTWEEFQLILAHISPQRREDYRRLLRWIECFGLRVGEACALTWEDVDWRNGRFRVRRGTTKTASGARWLPIPDELITMLMEVPPDDRRGRLFPDMTPHSVGAAMRKACQNAGIAVYSPHDLRHRRASLWSAQGTPDALVARRGGWANMAVPHSTYLHVIPPEDDVWSEFWATAGERSE